MTPLVSILIPCYNAAPWLSATLDSALAQTHPNTEIIVVDDGSRDHSLAIARDYVSRHPSITVIAQQNRGACAARNHALRLSRGDFIQYLDADDLLLPDKIERQLELARTPAGAGCLLSGEWARFHDNIAHARTVPDALWTDLDAVTWQTIALAQNIMIHPASWLVPRALADAGGPWDERLTLNDDGEYFSRLRFLSRRIPFCRGARSLYRSGLPGSLSSPNSRRALESSFLSHELIHALLLSHDTGPAARQACADGWMHFAFQTIPLAPDLYRKALAASRALSPKSSITPGGGTLFRWIGRVCGWPVALRLRRRRAS